MQQINWDPTDAQLMTAALALVRNHSASINKKIGALTALRYLVEPIDNANGDLSYLTVYLSNPRRQTILYTTRV